MAAFLYFGDLLPESVVAQLKFARDKGQFDCDLYFIRRPPLAVAQLEHPGVAA